ncbi:son RNA binding protein [Haematobia irritans]|uniref:son RNA binding protein n=1 Tax=Haematobia irritans TaxID=7368 RepID=UPI003F502CDA
MAQETSNDTKGNGCVVQNPEKITIKKEKIDPEIEKKLVQLTSAEIKTEPEKNDAEESSEDQEDDSDTESQSSDDQPEEPEDDKKKVEPVKSSNEILAELFKVFNAAPPEELLDDKNLIEKSIKRKKDKKKKHKKHKSKDDEQSDGSEAANDENSGNKHKKKKKHKHKHKDSKTKKKSKDSEKEKSKDKVKERSKDKEKERSKDKKAKEKDKDLETLNDKSRTEDKHIHKRESSDTNRKHYDTLSHRSSNDHKRQHEKDDNDYGKRRKSPEKDKKHNSFYDGFREKDYNSKDRHRISTKDDSIKIKKEVEEKPGNRKGSDDDISEISLSDEESYLERRNRETDYKKYKSTNSFYAGSHRSRSRETDRDRNYNKDRYHRDDRHSHHNYHARRSKSRSRSRDLGIDKKRLLEIARKNAISMFKRGNLPGCDNMTEDVKDKVLLKMRYGGRTVEDLTEFCKKISNGEHLSDLSSDEGSDIDKSGNAKAFHHPFQLKEREPIVMHIRNSKPILPVPAKTDEQTKTITMQFPVSSGQQHRMTEAWIPVEPKEKLQPLPALPAATQSTTIFKSLVPKNALGKPLPTESEQEPAFKPVEDTTSAIPANAPLVPPLNNAPPLNVTESAPPQLPFTYAPPPHPMGVHAPALAPPIVPPPIPPPIVPNNFTPDVPVPSSNRDSIFPEPPANAMDVSSIISKRLNAMRRLQENPMDSEAAKMLYYSQREMSTWAASKHLPGQFTGSTGANVLKPSQLNSGPQVWAKRDQLTSSKPVTGGMGMHLLQKMGWKPGEGLGREKNGSLQPLLLDVKLDKRGLVAQEDFRPVKPKRGGGGGGGGGPPQIPPNPQDKHPVCLLNEITTKYKWTPPLYTLVHENGPSHSRMFLFSVQVNNETYTPTKLCNTKKEAKFQAAKLCLQQMGILPPS